VDVTITEEQQVFAEIPPDFGEWPHNVWLPGPDLLSAIFCYGVGLAVTLGLAALDLANTGQIVPPLILLIPFLAFRLWRLRRPWLILSADSVAARGLIGWRRLGRDEILGLRTITHSGGGWIEVTPKRRDRRGIRINLDRFDDPWIRSWFEGARDLTREDRLAEVAAVSRNRRYGATRAVRRARLKQARMVAWVFNLACGVLATGVFWAPVSYRMVLAAELAAPILGGVLVGLSRGLIEPWPRQETIRPNVAWALAPMAGAVAVSMAPHLIQASVVWGAATAGGVLAMALFWFACPRSSNDVRLIGMVGLICASAIFTLVTLTDIGLDASQTRIYASVVRDKRVTGSRAPTNGLLLSPWSDQTGGWTPVSRRFYDRVKTGSTVCLFRKDGALGLAWFDIDDCPTTPPAS
jgi:hypothetical protein